MVRNGNMKHCDVKHFMPQEMEISSEEKFGGSQ